MLYSIKKSSMFFCKLIPFYNFLFKNKILAFYNFLDHSSKNFFNFKQLLLVYKFSWLNISASNFCSLWDNKFFYFLFPYSFLVFSNNINDFFSFHERIENLENFFLIGFCYNFFFLPLIK